MTNSPWQSYYSDPNPHNAHFELHLHSHSLQIELRQSHDLLKMMHICAFACLFMLSAARCRPMGELTRSLSSAVKESPESTSASKIVSTAVETSSTREPFATEEGVPSKPRHLPPSPHEFLPKSAGLPAKTEIPSRSSPRFWTLIWQELTSRLLRTLSFLSRPSRFFRPREGPSRPQPAGLWQKILSLLGMGAKSKGKSPFNPHTTSSFKTSSVHPETEFSDEFKIPMETKSEGKSPFNPHTTSSFETSSVHPQTQLSNEFKIPESPPLKFDGIALGDAYYNLGKSLSQISAQAPDPDPEAVGRAIAEFENDGMRVLDNFEQDIFKNRIVIHLREPENQANIKNYYLDKSRLVKLHSNMQETITDVINAFGSEGKTLDAFEQMITYSLALLSKRNNADETHGAITTVNSNYPNEFVGPLSPMVLFNDIVKRLPQDEMPELMSNIPLGGDPALDVLTEAGKKAEEYSQLLGKVNEMEGGPLQVEYFRSHARYGTT